MNSQFGLDACSSSHRRSRCFPHTREREASTRHPAAEQDAEKGGAEVPARASSVERDHGGIIGGRRVVPYRTTFNDWMGLRLQDTAKQRLVERGVYLPTGCFSRGFTWRLTFSSRPEPTEMSRTGTPARSSRRAREPRASTGRSSHSPAAVGGGPHPGKPSQD